MTRRSESGKRKTPVAWDSGKIKIYCRANFFLFRFIGQTIGGGVVDGINSCGSRSGRLSQGR